MALENDSIWNNPAIRGESGTFQYPEPHGYSKDPPGINNTANYTDSEDADEIQWAASELYVSTKRETYKTYFDNHLVTGMCYGSGWSRVTNLANFAYAMAFRDQPDPTHSTLINSIRAFADVYLDILRNKGFGTCLRPEDYYWGSNILTGHYAYSFILAYELLGDIAYRNAALSLVNYLFGANSLNKVFLTGLGENRVDNIFHLPSRFDGVDEVVPGLIPGGPNQYPEEWDLPHSDLISNENPPPAKCYIDSKYSYASNETSVNENSIWAFVTGYFYKHPQTPVLHQTRHSSNTSIGFYPNPASSEIIMQAAGEYEFRIQDITGRNVFNGALHNEINMDVSAWRPGVYIISIQSDTKSQSASFLVE
jgi:endoglucanase